jgi:hypothetical protein
MQLMASGWPFRAEEEIESGELRFCGFQKRRRKLQSGTGHSSLSLCVYIYARHDQKEQSGRQRNKTFEEIGFEEDEVSSL